MFGWLSVGWFGVWQHWPSRKRIACHTVLTSSIYEAILYYRLRFSTHLVDIHVCAVRACICVMKTFSICIRRTNANFYGQTSDLALANGTGICVFIRLSFLSIIRKHAERNCSHSARALITARSTLVAVPTPSCCTRRSNCRMCRRTRRRVLTPAVGAHIRAVCVRCMAHGWHRRVTAASNDDGNQPCSSLFLATSLLARTPIHSVFPIRSRSLSLSLTQCRVFLLPQNRFYMLSSAKHIYVFMLAGTRTVDRQPRILHSVSQSVDSQPLNRLVIHTHSCVCQP